MLPARQKRAAGADRQQADNQTESARLPYPEVEKQSDDYFQRLHRAAIEMIGVNGR